MRDKNFEPSWTGRSDGDEEILNLRLDFSDNNLFEDVDFCDREITQIS